MNKKPRPSESSLRGFSGWNEIPHHKLSVIVITHNEEENIADFLESVKWADEVVVVDQSSTDATMEIACKFTDKVFVTAKQDTANVDRMFAIEKASYDWILLLDADERVPKGLEDEIKKILQTPSYSAYYLGRRNFFLGRWIRHGGWYPAYAIKLFKKGYAYFPPKVHHDGYARCKAGYIKQRSLHYTYRSLTQYFSKFNRFTRRLAKEKLEQGTRVTNKSFALYFLFKPCLYFLRKYFLWGGFRDGFPGLFISFSSALVIFVSYAKLWERQRVIKQS